MKTEKIETLLDKYLDGKTTLEEEQQLKKFFAREDVPEHLLGYRDQFRFFDQIGKEDTEADPLAKIVDADEDRGFKRLSLAGKGSTVMQWSLRIAAGLILLLIGLSAGLVINMQDRSTNRELAALQEEVQQMKQALMYGSYQQASASERISAVNMTARLSSTKELDEQITEILIYTMNNDKNVNVRLAAAEALFRFREEAIIGKALTNSLSRQNDPLMQITLIDMLVKIKEKSAINEMQKMLINTETQEVVRERLQSGIAELKT